MTVHTSSQAAVTEGLNTAHPSTVTDDSAYWHLEETTGNRVSKASTLSASNTTASNNLFQLTGTVEITRLFAEVTTVTTLVNCTALSFDLYDSTAAVPVTDAAPGATLSGLAVGTFMVKDAAAATVLAVADNAAGIVTEGSTNKVFDQFFITQKTGANTYMRLTYTTTDAPINAVITVYADYIAMGSGTLVAV